MTQSVQSDFSFALAATFSSESLFFAFGSLDSVEIGIEVAFPASSPLQTTDSFTSFVFAVQSSVCHQLFARSVAPALTISSSFGALSAFASGLFTTLVEMTNKLCAPARFAKRKPPHRVNQACRASLRMRQQ